MLGSSLLGACWWGGFISGGDEKKKTAATSSIIKVEHWDPTPLALLYRGRRGVAITRLRGLLTQKLGAGARGWGRCVFCTAVIEFRWTPHPVIVTLGDNRDYIRVLLYAYYTTITGWGVLLT